MSDNMRSKIFIAIFSMILVGGTVCVSAAIINRDAQRDRVGPVEDTYLNGGWHLMKYNGQKWLWKDNKIVELR